MRRDENKEERTIKKNEEGKVGRRRKLRGGSKEVSLGVIKGRMEFRGVLKEI